jgi:hypothetical protein
LPAKFECTGFRIEMAFALVHQEFGHECLRKKSMLFEDRALISYEKAADLSCVSSLVIAMLGQDNGHVSTLYNRGEW